MPLLLIGGEDSHYPNKRSRDWHRFEHRRAEHNPFIHLAASLPPPLAFFVSSFGVKAQKGSTYRTVTEESRDGESHSGTHTLVVPHRFPGS